MLLASPYVLLAAAAVLVFWMVGAHNRLVALRNAMVEAWARIDEALKARAAAAVPLLAALREPLAAEQGALDTVQAALNESTRASGAMGSRPVSQDHASAWMAAESGLSAAATRLFALLDQQPELRLQDHVAMGTAAWREANARLAFARQVFNEAAEVYNGAIALFPTRLLVPMLRFGPAGRL